MVISMESIFDILYIPMGYILRFAYSLTDNYLFAIFLFSLVMEIILSPLAIKQQKNQIKQASLAPKQAAIRKKYAGRTDQATQQKMQNEIMEMYKAENFNSAGGCGTMLIQFPIIICLYNVVTNPLRYICNVPKVEIEALKNFLTSAGHEISLRNTQIEMINIIRGNVSNYYSVAPSLEKAIIPDFTVGPFDLSQVPEISFSPFNWLMLIPVITFVVMIISTKIMQKFTYQSPETAEAQNNMSMKIMTWTMPLLSVYFEFQLAAAIGVYWIFRNILQLVEKFIISKLYPVPKFTEEDFKEAERQAGLSERQKKRENKEYKKFVRSLHHIDDEEYLERHAEDLKALEESKTEKSVSKGEIGETSSASNAPAPIKNDERVSYKAKNKENKKENTDNSAKTENSDSAE